MDQAETSTHHHGDHVRFMPSAELPRLNFLKAIAQEAESILLLRRLDALERLVFGRSCPAVATTAPAREVEPLASKVETISKSVARAEGGDRDFQDLAAQASKLGLLSPPGQSTASAAIVQNVALKENILYAARGDIETTARLLSQVKTLQEEHVNPPYLRDMPHLTDRLSRLEGTYIRQATEATRINERAENARLHYSEAVNLVSEKFVHWDDQVAELERQHGSRP